MEREEKNPYVTKIEVDDVERRLTVKIDDVDKKHDNNYADLSKLIAISEVTSENIVKSNDKLSKSFDNFSYELKEELKSNRKSHEDLSVRVSHHDMAIFEHNEFITKQKEITDSKKSSLLKWVATLSAIFVAILTGIFGVVEVLIPYLIGGK